MDLGERLGRMAAGGTVFALVGDLGLGKTHFVRGFARGAGVEDLRSVVSPTYTLANEYPAEGSLMVHMDFYRLTDSDSARGLGLEEPLGRGDTVSVIEWADKIPDIIPDDAVWVHFEWVSPRERKIEVRGVDSPKGLRLIEHL
jgi:tRNA threonylcarbamoyladenosine biosynthesis protein TsaE